MKLDLAGKMNGASRVSIKVVMKDCINIAKTTSFQSLPTEKLPLFAQSESRDFVEARHRRNLEQVQEYEKGPTYPFLLWFPVVQQLAKACLVSGSRFTIAVGAVFMVSFLIAEILLLSPRSPLTRNEHTEALKLMHSWTTLERKILDPYKRS
jgi:hypothetical protein